jgi:hypothetical protein
MGKIGVYEVEKGAEELLECHLFKRSISRREGQWYTYTYTYT